MDFQEIKGLIERFLPTYLKAKNISFDMTFPSDKEIKIVAHYKEKSYLIQAKEL